jgi:hypothetical protein
MPIENPIGWFHVFVTMIDSGSLAELSGSAVKVYLVIKRLCDFSEGTSNPVLKTIQKLAGLGSEACVAALNQLEEKGYIQKIKVGRSVHYKVIEMFPIEGAKQASFSYSPQIVKNATKELNRFLLTKQTPNGGFQFIRIDHVENLNINIFQNDGHIDREQFSNLSPEKLEKAFQLAEQIKNKEISAWDAVRTLKEMK